LDSDPKRSHHAGGAAPIEEQRRRLREIHPAIRFLAVPVIAFVLIHTVLIALWVAPMTPAREQLGNDRLRSYILPWFEQNWSIFAPNPRRTAVTFEVRAVYEDINGQSHTSEWTDLVDIEDDIVRGNPMGSRASKITRRLADRMHSARSNMSNVQLDWVAANYFDTPVEQLRERLLDVKDGTGTHHVDRYLQADYAATTIATAAAERRNSDTILRVQYRTSTRQAPQWKDRHEKDLDEQPRSYRDYGWRAPADLSEQDIEYFDVYLDLIDEIEPRT